ncbi:DUF389 domain-containing protein [Halomarina salina]|uniref:DUF389 domain-containing protein n=1 Tax=Halomarina salina TaxID=1872699 RepID=A0ABD5RPJ1_9EURY|nr:DUF389 domain-containing protein [Halomarina salina]
MRLVRVLVPEAEYAPVADDLRAEGFEVVTSRAYDDAGETTGSWLLELPVPNAAVGKVFEIVEETDVSEEVYTVVLEAEAVATPKSDELRDRYSGDYAPLTWAELRAKAQDLTADRYSYVGMMVLSAIIATAALLMDSPAVLVGSMVIAPLVSPVITASVGALTADREMLTASLVRQVGGVAVAVLAATLVSFAFRFGPVAPAPLDVSGIELVGLRMSPGVLALVVGAASGAAAAFAFVTRGTTELVGVMIAAALVPAAAATGVGIAWGSYTLAFGTMALLFVTLVLINGCMAGTLVVLGYWPLGDVEVLSWRPAAVVVGACLLVALATVAGVGGHVGYATGAKAAVGDVVERPAYAEVKVLSTSAQYAATPASEPRNVSVVLSRPASSQVNGSHLAGALSEHITAETGQPTTVDVRFHEYYRSRGATATNSTGPTAATLPIQAT